MIVELKPGEEWVHPVKGAANVPFASASSPDNATVSVWLDDELIDRVYLQGPHSWWTGTNQPFVPQPINRQTLRVRSDDGHLAIRIDLQEFDAPPIEG